MRYLSSPCVEAPLDPRRSCRGDYLPVAGVCFQVGWHAMGPSAFDLAHGLLVHTLTCDDVRAELLRQANSLDGPDDLVHFLGHFVADQDIRGRDPDYAKWQEGELRRMLMPNEGSGD